ncbi:hypothetical protein BDV95DRAFT_487903 [Massariosphaeria phaeospora]|uniref:Uncharacterized protein n=1 Tax=Massariosphaeria phaeospora TaxID=100035 RepID=A0A7C8IAD4_9PLEO|nr:hypothetical protein BDV95DRAFT_487903 [Massariosphaeria phaeospora]
MYPPPEDKLECCKGQYKYELIGPPKQKDPVLRLIRQTIGDLGKVDMRVSGAGYRVQNLASGPPIWPLSSKNVGFPVKLYAFWELGDEFPFVLPVSIVDRGSPLPLTAERVLVKIRGEWTSLKTWLAEHLGEWYQYPIGALFCQQKWWKKNGKVFPLMQLPTELRLLIFRHILGYDIRPTAFGNDVTLGSKYWNNPWSVRRSQDDSYITYLQALALVPEPDYTIFRVSKQVRDEAFRAGWEGTRKCFVDLECFLEVLSAPNAPSSFNWISKIQLDFTQFEYFDFLGVEIDPFMRIDFTKSNGHVLQQLTTLVQLELNFRSPYDHRDGEDPWSRVHSEVRDRVPTTAAQRAMRRYPCHKTITNWILTFFFPFIKHIPNVYLTGAIKSVTKGKWDRIFACEFREQQYDFRTHGYIWEDEIEEILHNRPVYRYSPLPSPIHIHTAASLTFCLVHPNASVPHLAISSRTRAGRAPLITMIVIRRCHNASPPRVVDIDGTKHSVENRRRESAQRTRTSDKNVEIDMTPKMRYELLCQGDLKHTILV